MRCDENEPGQLAMPHCRFRCGWSACCQTGQRCELVDITWIMAWWKKPQESF